MSPAQRAGDDGEAELQQHIQSAHQAQHAVLQPGAAPGLHQQRSLQRPGLLLRPEVQHRVRGHGVNKRSLMQCRTDAALRAALRAEVSLLSNWTSVSAQLQAAAIDTHWTQYDSIGLHRMQYILGLCTPRLEPT